MSENKSENKTTNKNRWTTIIVMIVTVTVAVLMYIAIFGNGTGVDAVYTSEDSFSQVKITQSASGSLDMTTRANILVQTGDEFSVSTDSKNGKETLECTVENDVLTITLATKQDILGQFFSSDTSTIIITIPENSEIASMSVKAEIGNFDFDKITAGSFTFDGDNTVVDFFDCNFESSSVGSVLGNVSAYDTAFGDFTFDGGTTNPEFKNCTFGEFDVYVEFGSLYVTVGEMENINLVADMGYVDLTEITLAGYADIYADYGAVVFSIVGDVEDYILDCKISESGKFYLDENLAEGKDDSLQQLTIATYIGDIDVSFVN